MPATNLAEHQLRALYARMSYLEVTLYAQAHRDYDGTLLLIERLVETAQRQPASNEAIPGAAEGSFTPGYNRRYTRLKPAQVPVPAQVPAPEPVDDDDEDEGDYVPARIRQRPERPQRRYDGEDFHDAPYSL